MHYVINNEQYFAVADDAIDALREDILDAVHRGGGFVGFSMGTAREMQLLVTSHTPVRIQRADQPEDTTGEDPLTPAASRESASADVDWSLEWQ